MDTNINLNGRKYIITGASSGIGKTTALVLASFGATLYLIARNEERLEETLRQLPVGEHKYYVYDLNDVDGIEGLVKQIVADNGRMDGLVHSAGLGFSRPLKSSKYEFMQEMLRINFHAFAELTRVVSLKKYCNNSGSIVGVSSIESVNGLKANSGYCASKGAMDSFVRVAAKELVKKNIRVNSVQPAWVRTKMMGEYLESIAGNSIEAMNKTSSALETVEVARVIAFLLSDISSGINGASIPIMGKQY